MVSGRFPLPLQAKSPSHVLPSRKKPAPPNPRLTGIDETRARLESVLRAAREERSRAAVEGAEITVLSSSSNFQPRGLSMILTAFSKISGATIMPLFRETRRATFFAAMAGLLAFLIAIPSAQANPGISSSGPDPEPAAIEKAIDAMDDGKHRRAARYLKRHLKKNRDDADALNLMGYSLRKLGQYDQSEQYYLRALEIEPQHLGANEYLGELYLQTGRPELARGRLAVLEKACPSSCEERDELAAALHSYSSGDGP